MGIVNTCLESHQYPSSLHSETMAEKFCLKWNDFQANISSTFSDLRKDNEFTDVTLACEDGQQVEAHKVILAASSPFFKNILGKNKHTNPLIYMRGIKTDELVAILDFLYYGKTNVVEENLDNFLALAEELKLKGLSKSSGIEANPINADPRQKTSNKKKKPFVKEENIATDIYVPINEQDVSTIQQEADADKALIGNLVDGNLVALPCYTFTGEMQDLDAKIKSMMAQSQNMIQNGKGRVRAHICRVCGKEGLGRNIKDHIESNHIDGVSISCQFCEKTFRSRHALWQHNKNSHTVA